MAGNAQASLENWQGVGNQLNSDTQDVADMLKAAKLDWKVEKHPCYAMIDGRKVRANRELLVRDMDNRVLDEVPSRWKPVQNEEALSMVYSYVQETQMRIVAGGDLQDGRLVWFLVRTGQEVEIVEGDWIDNHLLFTNPHKFAQSVDVRLAPIRRVSQTTMTLPVHSKPLNFVRATHRTTFDPKVIESEVAASRSQMQTYQALGQLLSSKTYDDESLEDFMRSVFPVITYRDTARKQMSKACRNALDLVTSHPGADFAPGTWWQALNAAIYYIDHYAGRTEDVRITSAWFGEGRKLKDKALQQSVLFAENVIENDTVPA